MDEVVERAVDAFRAAHPGLRTAPVVAVIPALNEAAAIAGVLDDIPPEWCGLPVQTLVVDDGSTDGTGAVAAAHGALVTRLERNLGQGGAFRAGYRIAAAHGAGYIVTLDADGQWDPRDAPGVLAPVVAGEADLVLGSRVLGRTESGDQMRAVGVRVFAGLVRALTGVRVTDTSSGLRAMRVEVALDVPLREPQYQSSELLVGAICRGFRVAERPVVMHRRLTGRSVKGSNLRYGLRYARVLLRTWRRERTARPRAADVSPARS